METKKILIIVPSIKVGGGAEKVATFLADNLSGKHEIKLLTFYDDLNELALRSARLTFSEKKITPKIIKLVVRSLKIVYLCKKHKINTVISHMEESNFPSILSKYLGNKSKIIAVSHNNPKRYGLVYKWLIGLLYPRADLLVSVSLGTRKIFEKYFKISRCETIYNAINVQDIKNKSGASLPEEYENIFKESLVFLSIGRLETYKGYLFLLEAFSKIANDYPNIKLVVLGDGSLRKKMALFIERNHLEGRIFLLGKQNNVFPFIKKSSCFLFPSLHEGFGIVLLEALACNVPVISTDCKFGPREILAPEIGQDKKINYPFKGRFGTLIRAPRESCGTREDIAMFSREMRKFIENNSRVSPDGIVRAMDFDNSRIIHKWIDIV